MMSFLLLLVIAFAAYYPHVIEREEAFLHEKFGDIYNGYRARTPAWIPNFRLWKSPQLVPANPRFMLLTLRDAVWFLLAFPLVELIEYGHETGVIPVLLYLY